MKCNSCGSEWKASPDFSNQTKCPFCGRQLTEKPVSTDLTAADAVKEIINRYGMGILQQKERFIGLFGDIAPKLSHEKRLLLHAFAENIQNFFIRCKDDQREDSLRKAGKTLTEVLNRDSAVKILEIFTKAFGWDNEIDIAPAEKTFPNRIPPEISALRSSTTANTQARCKAPKSTEKA